MAEKKIEAVTRHIEVGMFDCSLFLTLYKRYFKSRTSPSNRTELFFLGERWRAKEKIWTKVRRLDESRLTHRASDEITTGEDFRTALQSATNILSSLVSFQSSYATGSMSSSSSTPNPSETDHQVIETMSKLIDILRRSLRVRYELKIAEVLHVYVLPLTKGFPLLTSLLASSHFWVTNTPNKLEQQPIDSYDILS